MQKTSYLFILFLLLLISPAWARMMSISKDKVNVRSGPSLRDSVLLEAPIAYPLDVESEKGDWLCVKDWLGNRGWVYRQYVSAVETVVVLVENANIRSAPDLHHDVTKTAKRGEIYRVLDKKPKWVRIGYFANSQPIGWIRKDMIFGEE